MHGIKQPPIGLTSTLSLIKFLKFEGKTDLDGTGKPISKFEQDIFTNILAAIERADLSMEEQILAGLVITQHDTFDGGYLKVCVSI